MLEQYLPFKTGSRFRPLTDQQSVGYVFDNQSIVGEFSRVPLVFPRPNISTSTVIAGLTLLCPTCSILGCIPPDRAASNMSEKSRKFTNESGVAVKEATAYNSNRHE